MSTIYSKAFKPQKAQARRVATQLQQLGTDIDDGVIQRDARKFLLALSGAMLQSPQKSLQAPRRSIRPDNLVDDPNLTPRPISLALVSISATSSRREQIAYETHVRGEAAFAASLVRLLKSATPSDNIFVATPHRIQRHAVKAALKNEMDELTNALSSLQLSGGASAAAGKITVDTVERLQGTRHVH